MLKSAGSRGPVVGFDIENAPWAYWFPGETTARVTAICWKPVNGDLSWLLLTRTGRWIDEDGKKLALDKGLLRFRKVVEDCALCFGHNIRRHDLGIINGSLLRLQLGPLPSVLTTDTLKDYPSRRGMAASLEALASMYGLDGSKKSMSVPDWEYANELTSEGIEETRQRVVGDVLLQEQLRQKLLDLGILGPPRKWRSRP